MVADATEKVLIISLDPLAIKACEDAATRAGFAATVVSDLKNVSTPENFSLIFLDRLVGGISAMPLMESWRERPEMEAIPILVMLEGSEPQDIYNAYHFGGDAVFQKPLDVDHLISIIKIIASEEEPN